MKRGKREKLNLTDLNTSSTTKKDIYDIIIENIRKQFKERNYSMGSFIPQEKWEIPKYSKSEINNAGKLLAQSDISDTDRNHALEVLNNWRASHAYPLQVITSNLRRTNPNAIVVQRLKRLDSITGKIQRFPDMSLYRMQDLGGCRVIVDTIDNVYASLNAYKNSRIRHTLKREYDYIQNPKESGYRSYHMVYQFHSDTKETYNKNMLIEVQFRTKLQHTWATAVEMMGIYTKSNLKSSQGDKDVLRFFLLVSSVFALMEKMPSCPGTPNTYDELINEIRYLDQKGNIVSGLSALNVAINHTSKQINMKSSGYYILILDYDKKFLRVRPFKSSNIEAATQAYGQIESSIKRLRDNKDVVLVSAGSFESLKAAYPNYFVDIEDFVQMMRRILA